MKNSTITPFLSPSALFWTYMCLLSVGKGVRMYQTDPCLEKCNYSEQYIFGKQKLLLFIAFSSCM